MLMTHDADWSSELKKSLAQYDTETLGKVLAKEGVVLLNGFLPKVLRLALTTAAEELLDSHGKHVDVNVKSTGNTPRKYISVSRNSVFEHSPLIATLYSDPELMRFMADLTNTNVIVCPYEPEQIVVNQMGVEGDTHGWHWDDYSYSLVLVLEIPEQQNGAQLEYLDGTYWDKSSAQVQHYLENMRVKTLELTPGSAYVLLGKRVMHRVSPLLEVGIRKIVCYSYATEEERLTPIDHESMENIYG